ncbi:MAG: lamin tail domain-containing protein [Sandaracinaceae bacterium]|nr:lamin tail domain-containing protein [Sandaracinaceae bacterium]
MDAGPPDGGPGDAGPSDGGPSDGGGDAGGVIDGRPLSPLFGAIVFNEVLTDGTAEGDPNGDGDANPVEDQFVELVSTGGSVDMGGFTLVEQDLPDLPRHTFAGGFVLDPGHAVVVFGGGDAPDATASTTFFVANAADPGLPFGLHLSTPADTVWLLDVDGAVVARFCVGGDGECAIDAATDESLTRDPDVTGAFVPHRDATGSGGEAFSVGTRVDGSAF